ncbi:hypothetical protein B0H17DRAFT_1131699 [Mycena rosella]|uniref:Uncharacterized protein n=1 Tax=Mycena rosella TaxID=1033263 RepID=A0AAD7DLV0_MYCRO|nr:hypothetical protein B0H17DRAFT_1131699 [Mycena rosella]
MSYVVDWLFQLWDRRGDPCARVAVSRAPRRDGDVDAEADAARAWGDASATSARPRRGIRALNTAQSPRARQCGEICKRRRSGGDRAGASGRMRAFVSGGHTRYGRGLQEATRRGKRGATKAIKQGQYTYIVAAPAESRADSDKSEAMDIEITSDNEEHFLRSTQWDPDEWILAGKTYHDVPRVVDIARRDLLKIPAHFGPKLPSKSMSISRLLRYDLPPRSDGVECMDIDSNLFTTQKPTADIEDALPFLALPTRSLWARGGAPAAARPTHDGSRAVVCGAVDLSVAVIRRQGGFCMRWRKGYVKAVGAGWGLLMSDNARIAGKVVATGEARHRGHRGAAKRRGGGATVTPVDPGVACSGELRFLTVQRGWGLGRGVH